MTLFPHVRARVFQAEGASVNPAARRLVLAVAGCAVFAAAALAAHERLYSTFMEYDDEGYVLLTIKSYRAGQPLYDKTYTQYGPAFYFLESGLRGLTGLPLTHDATRLKTLCIWLSCSGLAAAIVYRLTRSPWLAIIGFGSAFLHLEKLTLEPGHPQEWCLLGLAVALFATTLNGAKHTLWRLFLVAAATAIVACIKLNLGVFLGLAIVLALLLGSEQTKWTRMLTWLVFAAAVAVPLVLLRAHLYEFAGWRLPAVVIAGLVGVMFAAKNGPRTTEPLELSGFIAGAGVLTTTMLLWAVLDGTTIAGLVEGLVLQHGRFTGRFYHAMPVPWWTPVWAGAAVALGFAARGGSARALRYSQIVALGLLAYLGLTHLAETFAPLSHGLVDRGGARLIVALFAPLAWLIVWPNGKLAPVEQIAPRILLALVAVLHPLAVFPTPGTQLAIGSLPLLLGLLVVVHDLLQLPEVATDRLVPIIRYAAFGFAGLVVLAILARDLTLSQQRAGYVSLDLPGATRLKLPAEEIRRWQWAAKELRERGETFVGLHHAQCSLYFWAGLTPPTPINATFWSHLLSPGQQRRIIAALEKQPRSCVFNNRRSTSQYDPASPLAQYLLERYEPAAEFEGLEVWTRKPAYADLTAQRPIE
jgi:hypothetical protein